MNRTEQNGCRETGSKQGSVSVRMRSRTTSLKPSPDALIGCEGNDTSCSESLIKSRSPHLNSRWPEPPAVTAEGSDPEILTLMILKTEGFLQFHLLWFKHLLSCCGFERCIRFSAAAAEHQIEVERQIMNYSSAGPSSGNRCCYWYSLMQQWRMAGVHGAALFLRINIACCDEAFR